MFENVRKGTKVAKDKKNRESGSWTGQIASKIRDQKYCVIFELTCGDT